jgi:hypothetical protein
LILLTDSKVVYQHSRQNSVSVFLLCHWPIFSGDRPSLDAVKIRVA